MPEPVCLTCPSCDDRVPIETNRQYYVMHAHRVPGPKVWILNGAVVVPSTPGEGNTNE